MSDDHIKLGKQGEFAASLFYQMHDGIILERNWECQFGEVDIIALHDDCLVFCEVKTRKSLKSGTPEEQVSRKQKGRYIRCAKLYSKTCEIEYERIRFDVIAVYAHDEHSGDIRYIPNAFGEEE